MRRKSKSIALNTSFKIAITIFVKPPSHVAIQKSRSDSWRALAGRFHYIAASVRFGKLPADFVPEDLERLASKGPASLSERAVLRFLLHVWSHREFPFELSQTAGWDAEHRRAFIDWVTGRILGEPCRYF